MPGSSGRGGVATIADSVQGLREVFAGSVGALRLRPGRVAVALLEIGEWRDWLADAQALLSAEEAGRVERRRLAHDRDALALAYALHRLLLGAVFGVDPVRVPLDRDEHGCPRLPCNLGFTSLSHADGLVAVAVTTAGPVGVDIESIARAAVMTEIAHCVCHPSESRAMDALPTAARGAALLGLWVRKEAILKAAGVGLAAAMDSFTASGDGEVPWGTGPDAIRVRMLEVGDTCMAAVAGPCGVGIDCRWLRPGTRAGCGQSPGAGRPAGSLPAGTAGSRR